MDAPAALSRLAEALGIEARYWNIHGTLHETSPETMRLLLRNWGVDAASPADVEMAWFAHQEAAWRDALPPVVIAREPAALVVPVRLPSDTHGTVRWSVQTEGGAVLTGEQMLEQLPVEAVGQARNRQISERRLRLDGLPPGYHTFRLDADEQVQTRLIVAPARCYLPPSWNNGRSWGLATQLYALRTAQDWGIGDFGGLRELIDRASASGVDAIGLNPLHALFLDTPQDASPYSPCSRLFRNPLYLDVTAVPEFLECEEARAMVESDDFALALKSARLSDRVDYRSVARLKLAVLEQLYRHFCDRHGAGERSARFQSFVQQGGVELEWFTAFQALSEHFQTHCWQSWPTAYRDGDAIRSADFHHRFGQRTSFFKYLQWQCDEQIEQIGVLARSRAMGIGLYNDLAVSADAHSADHWNHRDLFAGEARVGAPPDPFNESGQEWGVVPWMPDRLKATGYDHVKMLLQANMRHTGALRIDHVMGWQRLFWIPVGAPPSAGAYVRYPLDDFLAIAALESQRHRCVVIGEDLGTVPEGFRQRMADADILSCRVLYFEREHHRFHRPGHYPRLATVSASTHDLPTLRGFWEACDLSAKARLGLFRTPEEEAQARQEREGDKRALLAGVAEEGLLPEGWSVEDAVHSGWVDELAQAVHRFLACTPSALLMVQLDDLAGEAHQTNLPGSTTQYPNWRRRYARAIGPLLNDPGVSEHVVAIAMARSK
ncbi:MAG: 4-alpha-glucanotransferase [Alphaproteobacteria bacterium]|nr:4-alpha-glucanotransferase [Alphaproteobacteria bacterium]